MKIAHVFYSSLFLMVILLGCSLDGNNTQGTDDWTVNKVEGQTVFFKNGKQFKTNLYDLTYIGQLKSKTKAPYLILSGRSCNECDANTSIYIHSPSDGNMKEESTQTRYTYPGKQEDYLTGQSVFESRMLYGSCLNNKSNCVVWVQKFLDEKKQWKQNAFVVEVYNDTLKEYLLESNLPDIQTMLKNGCKEVAGKVQTTEP
jgi:hypothetical protein